MLKTSAILLHGVYNVKKWSYFFLQHGGIVLTNAHEFIIPRQ